MKKIVREITKKGVVIGVSGVRGPFLTEVTMFDGKKRRLVVELHGEDIRVRYANCRRPLAVVRFDELVKRERAKRWKLFPRGRAA